MRLRSLKDILRAVQALVAGELQQRFQRLAWTEHRLRETGVRLRSLLSDSSEQR
ncbi:MAG TPA: hypothetical protein PKE12_02285 [Kiritimatiellia bacterium]|nr:hypothetical protein [Kiritimatiellia bacterium]